MKRFLTIILTGFILVGCSAAHNTKVREKISEEYGNGDPKRKVVVKKTSETVKENKTVVEKPTITKPHKPLLEQNDTEVLIATSKISVSKNTVEDYISLYAPVAMQSMKTYGIPASIKLAQGILESGSGNGTLCREANNHFGIKCKDEWTGETISHTDDAPDECFRKYKSALESYNDHSEFIAHRVYYKNLFTLDKSDYSAWAKGLKKAGYATDPKYAQKLISIIERYKLYEYDQKVLGNNTVETTPAKTETNQTTVLEQIYKVQAGDTLYAICQKFNSSVDHIKQLNNLTSNNLSVGQIIKIQ